MTGRNLPFFTCLLLTSTLFSSALVASQSKKEASNTQSDIKSAVVYETADPAESIWEFGVEVTAEGAAADILATCPIPVNNPEQTIEVIDEFKSDNVSEIKFKDLSDDARLMFVRVKQLPAGATARAVVRLKIQKKYILPPSETAELYFAQKTTGRFKAFLKESPYIEIKNKKVRAFVESIIVDESLTPWQQVESIYDTIRERIEYKFDTIIRSCPEAIEAKHGDCEEMSSLFIAACRLRGIPARAVWIPGHTYPEFYLEDEEGRGFWFPCQLAGTRQFGQMIEDRPILQKGDKFSIPGNSDETRYLMPTLTAKNAAAGLKLNWIANDISKTTPSVTRQNRE